MGSYSVTCHPTQVNSPRLVYGQRTTGHKTTGQRTTNMPTPDRRPLGQRPPSSNFCSLLWWSS